jgi:hypothetical protein
MQCGAFELADDRAIGDSIALRSHSHMRTPHGNRRRRVSSGLLTTSDEVFSPREASRATFILDWGLHCLRFLLMELTKDLASGS